MQKKESSAVNQGIHFYCIHLTAVFFIPVVRYLTVNFLTKDMDPEFGQRTSLGEYRRSFILDGSFFSN